MKRSAAIQFKAPPPTIALAASRRKKQRERAAFLTVMYLFMAAVAVVLLFPYAFMASRSLMSGREVSGLPVRFFPTAATLEAYQKFFSGGSHYMRYTLNTLKVLLCNMIAIPLSASLVAYGFAKLRFKGKGLLFAAMMGTVLLPGVVLQIPQYILFVSLGWNGTLLPMTVPNFFGGGAINVFLLRQFMRSLPKDLDDAAKIDGANALRRYWSIVLPLCVPVIIFVWIGVFNTYWGDYYSPLIYVRSSPDKITLALGIYNETTVNAPTINDANLRMAAGVFMSLPPAVIFFIFQRQLIDGIVMTGIKG
ncbi:MAG: carbohydrate ABC transporter permease [Clostridiales bacterium]|jgi:multiple sugar transport system permease protein|nr:carbohydrate ABC transporter permease [Clostridiales bacterium]